MGRGADILLLYRNEGGGQPWANRLAEEAISVYALKLRDRCRSGLSGSPGKRVLGKTNRGFESLPVRPYYVPQSRDFEGLGGQGILSVGGVICLGLNFPKQTRLALQSVGPSCGERDNPVRPLPVIFFEDDSLEVEW